MIADTLVLDRFLWTEDGGLPGYVMIWAVADRCRHPGIIRFVPPSIGVDGVNRADARPAFTDEGLSRTTLGTVRYPVSAWRPL